MTRWAAEAFAEVHAVDVSSAMIRKAEERLGSYSNLTLHLGSGYDLAFAADAYFDLVFSYIVFQHIPVRAAIENYIREAARVLKPQGAFKFQVNGDVSAAGMARERDTWAGETFSTEQIARIISAAGLAVAAAEGMGTQYFVLTCRKEPWRQLLPGPYILPSEPWAAAQLREGWGEPVDASWRPVGARCRAVLAAPRGGNLRFFLGLYFWPREAGVSHAVDVVLAGVSLGRTVFESPGDHFLELNAPPDLPAEVEVVIDITPPCDAPVRVLGLYVPAA